MIYLLFMLLILNKGDAELEVHVIQGGSFFRYVPASEDTASCNATFEHIRKNRPSTNISILLDPHSENIVMPSTYEDTRNLSTRLSSLGAGYCGFKLINSKTADPEHWTISAQTGTKVVETSFRVLHYGLDKMHVVQKVQVGSSTTINCGRPITQSQDFCQIYNPNGEYIFEGPRCSLFISMVTMQDLGTWRCVSGILQSMDTLEYIVELVSSDILENKGWVTETEDYYKIGCTITSNIVPDLCRMIDPTGHEYAIRSNLATERYTTFQTNLLNKTCGIEILKPLLEHEQGIWKCIMANDGHLLNVGNIADHQYNDTFSIDISLGDTFTIHCKVPYKAESCYIISPNGSRYSPDVPTRTHFGECSVSIKRASKTENGEWSCFFVKKDEIRADKVKFEVRVRDISCSDEVRVEKGGNAELFCQTGSVSLQYCWFISPTQEMYHLFNEYSSERLAYFGKGLEYGDCGIALFNVEENQYGNWSCIIRKGTDYRTAEEIHILKLLPISDTGIVQASSLGILVGMIFGITVAVLTFIFRKLKKQKIQYLNAVELNPLRSF